MTSLTEQEYHTLAHAALAHYALDGARVHFLEHNAGITFRVETRQGSNSFLLKIHNSINGETFARPELISARYQWLLALQRTSGLVVQTPILNRQGDLLTSVADPKGQLPYLCTLQQWVKGEWPGGDYTAAQVHQIGAMMARLHQFSSGWGELAEFAAALPTFEKSHFEQHVQRLHLAVHAGLLTEDDFALIKAAATIIVDVVERIRREPQWCGPIHNDFNHGNIIFDQDEVRIIDFDALSVGPYACDLAVMLYHIHYQGPTVYSALLQGYQTIRPLPFDTTASLEAFVTLSAITNCSFNATIPKEYELPYLARNLRQLVDEFCPNLVADRPFLNLYL